MSQFSKDILGIIDFYLIDKPLLKFTNPIIKSENFYSDCKADWEADYNERVQKTANYFLDKEILYSEAVKSISPNVCGALKIFEEYKTQLVGVFYPAIKDGFNYSKNKNNPEIVS